MAGLGGYCQYGAAEDQIMRYERSLPEVLSSGSRHCPGLMWEPVQAFSKKLR